MNIALLCLKFINSRIHFEFKNLELSQSANVRNITFGWDEKSCIFNAFSEFMEMRDENEDDRPRIHFSPKHNSIVDRFPSWTAELLRNALNRNQWDANLLSPHKRNTSEAGLTYKMGSKTASLPCRAKSPSHPGVDKAILLITEIDRWISEFLVAVCHLRLYRFTQAADLNKSWPLIINWIGKTQKVSDLDEKLYTLTIFNEFRIKRHEKSICKVANLMTIDFFLCRRMRDWYLIIRITVEWPKCIKFSSNFQN